MEIYILKRGEEVLRAYKDLNLAKRIAVKLSRSDKNMAIMPLRRQIFSIIPIKLK